MQSMEHPPTSSIMASKFSDVLKSEVKLGDLDEPVQEDDESKRLDDLEKLALEALDDL
jgi:hypothetical protein